MNVMVSVLIPCYNAARYLDVCLQSVFDQTFQNFEIILVDDGSTDDSLIIARRRLDPRLKIIQSKNLGGGSARNIAFEASTGKYITYLDADDCISPDKIKNQVMLMDQSSPGTIVSCKWARFYDKPGLDYLTKQRIFKSYDDPTELLSDMWGGGEMMTISCWMTPREIIEKAGNWNTELKINQDGEFFSRVIPLSNGVVYDPVSVAYYRSDVTQSVSQTIMTRERASSLFHSYNLCQQNLTRFLNNEKLRMGLARLYYQFIYQFSNSYPDLCTKALDKIQTLDVGYNNNIGGSVFKLLTSLFGFKVALKIRSIISKSP